MSRFDSCEKCRQKSRNKHGLRGYLQFIGAAGIGFENILH